MGGVGILVSFWDGLFSGAMLVSGRVIVNQTCEINPPMPLFVFPVSLFLFPNHKKYTKTKMFLFVQTLRLKDVALDSWRDRPLEAFCTLTLAAGIWISEIQICPPFPHSNPYSSGILGGGFKSFIIFIPIWGRYSFWLIFFRWVETINQIINDHKPKG